MIRQKPWVEQVRYFFLRHAPHIKMKEWSGNSFVFTCDHCLKEGKATLHGMTSGNLCCSLIPETNIFALWGYKALAKPIETVGRADRRKWKVRCNQGHTFDTSTRYLFEGHGCTKCFSAKITGPEAELAQFIQSKGYAVDPRNKGILEKARELDLYIPDRNLAVEYIGSWWHAWEKHQKSGNNAYTKDREALFQRWKYSFQNKALECHKKGIHLITIFEHEYTHHKGRVYQWLELIIKGEDPPTNEVAWVRPYRAVSEPRPIYLDGKYNLVSQEEKRYTLYDCGVLL